MNELRKDPNQQPESSPNPGGGRGMMWFYILLMAFFVFQILAGGFPTERETNWNEFESEMLAKDAVERIDVINGKRAEVTIADHFRGQGFFSDLSANDGGPHYFFNIGSVETLENKIREAETTYELSQPVDLRYRERTNWVANLLSWILPFVLIVAIWVFLMRRVQGRNMGGGLNPFDFGKSKALEVTTTTRPKVTFREVAGQEEAKEEVREIVEFLQNPERYTRLGGHIPRGVMLVGPPGTGKTLMARAVAGEAQVPFFTMSGSEFVEMFVGVGASRVRDLFRKAKERAPSIIFIDEIDAIGRARGGAFSFRTNDERESTLNQLLTEMDGFDNDTNVIVLAATNRADILDRALLRPGRFDRHIYLELPTLEERKAIFRVHMRPLQLAETIDLETLAAQTPGFSGADIANICNEAALIAARHGKDKIGMDDFYQAADRVIAGLEKKSKVISPEEKEIIAHHEAGHATVSWFLEHADKLMKVTIIPRGKSLGAAWYLPEEHVIHTRAQLEDRLVMALGGRAAEEIFFDDVSSGAMDDLEKATKQAYAMVSFYGLNENLGPISFYDSSGAYEQSFQKPYSESTARLIDEEVKKLLAQAYQRAKSILLEHREEAETIAELLLDKELITHADLKQVFSQPSDLPAPEPVQEQN